MTYKGNEKYGTSIGGLLSFCARLITTIFTIVLFLAFFIGGRDYNQQFTEEFLKVQQFEPFTISSDNFIPYAQIFTYDIEDFKAGRVYNQA